MRWSQDSRYARFSYAHEANIKGDYIIEIEGNHLRCFHHKDESIVWISDMSGLSQDERFFASSGCTPVTDGNGHAMHGWCSNATLTVVDKETDSTLMEITAQDVANAHRTFLDVMFLGSATLILMGLGFEYQWWRLRRKLRNHDRIEWEGASENGEPEKA